jgi:RHH-type proline utilization regulon transcriptional repressor/proline dehydrogenase/delta 1-pyrroline-5-carboxylate dehydrogenase
MDAALEGRTREVACELWRVEPSAWRHPLVALNRRILGGLDDRPALRSALFRFVDVAPACRGPGERGAHLRALLCEVADDRIPLALRPLRAGWVPPGLLFAYGLASGPATALLARQFIAGRSVTHATRNLRRIWREGQAFALDLLGEATVTEREAETYFERCAGTLRLLAEATRDWPDQPLLDVDHHGRLPRANLSIKLTALTPLLRPLAPELGAADAAHRLQPLLRLARDLGAHVHLDMEDYDSRETLLLAFEEMLADAEFRDAPSVGVVVQAYLRDAEETLDRILGSPALEGRPVPPTIRLVKGAYWDHERVIASQRGWEPPVWTSKHESDACFERLSRRLIDARDRVRPAIATHNLRSLAQAIAYLEQRGGRAEELELQVLRGLGDEIAAGLSRLGYRVRVYTPIGDLVAGMAYLVRRLLENSANQGFLAQRRHQSLDELLAPPVQPEARDRPSPSAPEASATDR